MSDHDIVIVGSGMNSLVCAGLLARAGNKVAVLERNDRLGGCIRTEELFEGFTHDVLSSWYPLFMGGPGYAELADDLAERGLEFAHTPKPTGLATPDGRSLVLTMDHEENQERLDGLDESGNDGTKLGEVLGQFFTRDAELTFGLLGGDLRTRSTAKLLFKEARSRKVTGSFDFMGAALETCRTWLERDFDSDLVQGLIAPWVLHAGLGPDDANSGLMGKVITGAIVEGGTPVAVGGSQKVLDAFSALVTDHGGVMVTNADVEKVLVENGKATGVVTADGTSYRASKAVVANVTPQQLYGRLLDSANVPDKIAAKAKNYRYGRSGMQIHYALSEPPTWTNEELADTALIHLTTGLDGVSRAVNEAERGLLPAEATVVVGQPLVVDPSRAPDGKWILWIQLQELPPVIKGDAAGEIDIGPDGAWTDEVAERYADRIHQRLLHHMPDLDSKVVGRKVYSPADLAGMNANLVGGDPYSGACSIDQMLLWRPMAETKNHATPVKGLFHIGAATHPGPGLGGNSGYLAAKAIGG